MQFLFHTSEPPICLIYGELRDKLPQKQSISRMYEPNQNEVIIVCYFGKNQRNAAQLLYAGTQPLSQILTGHAVGAGGHFLRCSRRNHKPAQLTAAGAHVDDKVGIADHVQVVFDDHYRGTVLDQCLEHTQKLSLIHI